MATLGGVALFLALRLYILLLAPLSSSAGLPPLIFPNSTAGNSSGTVLTQGLFSNSTSGNGSERVTSQGASNYWIANIQRQGVAAFNPTPSTYKVFRNVKDFGAKGQSAPITAWSR